MPSTLLTPLNVGIELIRKNNILNYATSLLPSLSKSRARTFQANYDKAARLLKGREDLNVLLLNALTQVAPASYIKSENDKEQIMRAFCDNVLLAKRNRQKEEPVGALLLLLSIKDRLLRVHTAGNKALITDTQGSKVISKIKGHLRRGDYGKAIVVGIQEIDRFIESNKYFESWTNWFRRWYMSFLSPVLVIFSFFLVRRNVIANYRQERYASLESQRLISDESAQEETESDVSQEEENFCGICLESLNDPSMFDTDLDALSGYERSWHLGDIWGHEMHFTRFCNVASICTVMYHNFLKGTLKVQLPSLFAFLICCWKYYNGRQICIEAQNESSGIRVLACGHSFHRSCIDRWLFHRSTCPLCRARILAQNVTPIDGEVDASSSTEERYHIGENMVSSTDTSSATYAIGDRIYVRTTRHSNRNPEHLPATIIRVFNGGERYDVRYTEPWRVRNLYPLGIRNGVTETLLTSWAWGTIIYGRHRQHRYNQMQDRFGHVIPDVELFWSNVAYGSRYSASHSSGVNELVHSLTTNVSGTTFSGEIHPASDANNVEVPSVLRGRDPSATWYTTATGNLSTGSASSKGWLRSLTSDPGKSWNSSSSGGSRSSSWGNGGGGASGKW